MGEHNPAGTVVDDAASDWPRVEGAARDLGPGWRALRLPPGAPSTAPFALLDRGHGVALVGPGPDPDAVAAVRGALEAGGVAAAHGGLPPVLYRPMPPPDLSLAEVVRAAFDFEPRPALADAPAEPWEEAVRRVLLGEAAPPPRPRAAEPPPLRREASVATVAAVPAAAPQPAAPEDDDDDGGAPPTPRRGAGRVGVLLLCLLLGLGAGMGGLWYAAQHRPDILPTWLRPR